MRLITVLAISAFALVGCGDATTEPAAQAQDDRTLHEIECTFAYNPAKQGREEVLTVQTGDQQDRDSVRFGDMSARISYFDDGFESPAFNVVVKSPGRKEDIDARLYQLERVSEEPGSPAARPENEFVGGHGFTGLGYVFDPDSKAELQFFCRAS